MKFKLFAFMAIIVGAIALIHFGSSSTAPDSRFILLDGSSRNLSEWRGKVVLVNFWATSCTSCVAEMPDLIKTYDTFQSKGFHTVAVAMHYDPPSYVVNFANTRMLPFDVAIDNTGVIAHDWGKVQVTPTTFIVNKKGMIVKKYVGTPNFSELHKLIQELLTET